MAKKKSAKKRRNPANPSHHKHKGGHPRRRRRNPKGDFGDRAVKLGMAALAAIGGGVVSYVAMSKLSSYGAAAEYGVPAAIFLTGAALAKSHPLIGAGLGIGAAAPFVAPLASKALAAMPASTTPATTTTNGIAAVVRQLGAVQMRSVYGAPMRGVYNAPMRGVYNAPV